MKKITTLFFTIAFLSALQCNAFESLKVEKKPLTNLVDCAVPTNLIIADITSTSVNFSWTAAIGGDFASLFYQYCVVTSPIPEAGPTNFTGTFGSSYFTLTPGTTYYVYVRSFCNANDTGVWSDWSAPATFTTTALSVTDFTFSAFSSYPNPVNDIVKLSNGISINHVEIFNSLGQNIFSQKFNGLNVEVNFANFSQGHYFMTVHSGESTKTIRLIKN